MWNLRKSLNSWSGYRGSTGRRGSQRGKLHKYLGMKLDFWDPGELRVTMVDYLKGVLEDFPEVITGRSTSPAANHLFQVRPEYKWILRDK